MFAFANLFLTIVLAAASVLAGLAASRDGEQSEELVAMAARAAFGASGTVAVVEGFAYVVFGTRLVKRIGGKRGGNDKSAKIVHISARCGGALTSRAHMRGLYTRRERVCASRTFVGDVCVHPRARRRHSLFMRLVRGGKRLCLRRLARL